MTETTDAITYDELLANRPQIFTIDKHQAFEANGVILVTATPALDMVPLAPGQQLNYTYDSNDGLTSYSVGPDEGASEAKAPPASDEPEQGVVDDAGTKAWPKKGKGGWFELSDGSKVRGQEKAEKAQATIDADA